MEELQKKLIDAGAHNVACVDLKTIVFDEGLVDMCKMNTCGNYNTNWGCPPGAKQLEEAKREILSFKKGIVYQRIEEIEDSFDYEGMVKSGEEFSKLTLKIKEIMEGMQEKFLVLGAGGCNYCEKCTYPIKECAYPNKKNTSVEACGIFVSNLCQNAGLNYINGANTVTNTGLIAF